MRLKNPWADFRGEAVGLVLAALLPGAVLAEAGRPIEFNRDIRPILSDNCYTCHGPDEAQRKARLRLDLPEAVLQPAGSGKAPVVAGDPGKSEIIQRITTRDEDDLMPPPQTNKRLTAQQIDLLTRWIQAGARWEQHWAFVKPQRPSAPSPAKNEPWPRNDIDRFVWARLAKESLTPTPEADKSTLLRRVSLDLTGLPPTVPELDAFLADTSPQAYERAVDRLLRSPRYGEHLARYWLDAVRYADSHGYHIDAKRSMWKYREWVINAFNQNMPFDQFTVEQLAGDLLPRPTTDQLIGSGYIRANMSTSEGGAIEEEYQAKYTFDRAETTSTIWLGLTMTCARCHTHKYDPITQREYYGFYAFFNSLNESVMDGNRPDPAPVIRVPTAQQKERLAWLKQHIADASGRLEAPVPELDQAQAEWQASWHRRLSGGWATPLPHRVHALATNGAQLRVLDDKSILALGPNPEQDVYEYRTFVDAGRLAALRLEVLPHVTLPKSSSTRAEDGRFRLSEFEAELAAGGAAGKAVQGQKLKFTRALADTFEANYEAEKSIDGKPETGWGVAAGEATAPHTALFLLASPVTVATNAELIVRLRFEASKSRRAIGRFRLATARDENLVNLLSPPKPAPWQLVGPFKTEGLQEGFAAVYAPETEIDFKKVYAGVREEIRWHARGDLEDGKNHLLVNELHGVHGAYYLHRMLKLNEAKQVQMSLRADTLFKMWVNGKLVGQRAEPEKAGEGPLKLTVDLAAGTNAILLKVVNHQGACYFSFSTSSDDREAVPAEVAAILATTEQPAGPLGAKLRNHFRRQHSPTFKELGQNLDQWREEEAGLEKSIPLTMIAKELDQPRETRLLVRGEYDKKGEKVLPGVPAVLPPFPQDAPTNRLGLAKWLLDPAHPLTARVTVNRFWQQLFGVGLVKTTEDFGAQGEPPSHPELLDWLATEFVRSGWDVKHLLRLMVTSATYRQSSLATKPRRERDPENRLLAWGPRFRMDAEMVRDSALFLGGLLVERMGGQSVKPYEPPGLWEAVSFNNSQKYVPDTGEGNHRRSLYTFWKRQSPPPNMLLFDAPTREFCVVRRPRTNTPLQALALLNDPQFVEASRSFAQRILLEGGRDAESRLVYAFRLATARAPKPDELKVLSGLLQRQLEEYRSNQAAADKLLGVGQFPGKPELDKSEVAAWTTIASLLMNLDEAVTKG